VASPHDALFKYVFSQPEHAASELRSVLPAEVAGRLDWNSLELQPASFVDERLSGRQADLLFTVRCEERPAYVYVLLEHQSTCDPLMAFRLLRYLVRIWDAFLVAHPDATCLPAIVPIVVHHSNTGWTRATDFCSILDVDAETLTSLAAYLPQFRFVLDDVSSVDDQALRGRSLTAVAAAGLMLLSRARSAPDLLETLRGWSDVLANVARAHNGLEALSAFLEYAFRVGEVEPEQLRQLAHELGPVAEEAYMTAAQKLTQESYARGCKEGEAKGKAEGEAKGKAEGKAELLLRLLVLRFGSLSEDHRQKVLQASPECLDRWAERVITGESIEEILS
jgi:predicted transposase/invertase (TIGR01784 family)